MVAYLYRFLVSLPVIWAMKPGVGGINWSTDMRSPGAVISSGCCWVGVLDLHDLRVDLTCMHAEHTGMGHLASFLGITPILAMYFSLVNEMWPNCLWYYNSRVALGVTSLSSDSSMGIPCIVFCKRKGLFMSMDSIVGLLVSITFIHGLVGW